MNNEDNIKQPDRPCDFLIEFGSITKVIIYFYIPEKVAHFCTEFFVFKEAASTEAEIYKKVNETTRSIICDGGEIFYCVENYKLVFPYEYKEKYASYIADQILLGGSV